MENTKIKNIWSVLCQKAHIDSRTNLLSLLDIVEQLNIEHKGELPKEDTKPLLFPISMTLAGYWQIPDTYKNKEIEIISKVISPNGEILGSSNVQFKTNKGYHKTLIDFPQLPITIEGKYLFETYIKNRGKENTVSTIPLIVNIKEIIE